MRKFVENHVQQIELIRGRSVVQSVIPGETGKAVRIHANITVEARDDVIVEGRRQQPGIGRTRREIGTGKMVRQRRVIPRVGPLGILEVREDLNRASGPEDTRRFRACQRPERGLDDDVDIGRQRRLPDRGCRLEHDSALLNRTVLTGRDAGRSLASNRRRDFCHAHCVEPFPAPWTGRFTPWCVLCGKLPALRKLPSAVTKFNYFRRHFT